MTYKLTVETQGRHAHCSLFSAKEAHLTFAKCGSFVIDAEHVDDFAEQFPGFWIIENAESVAARAGAK